MAVYLYWWSAGVLKCPGRADISLGFGSGPLLTEALTNLLTEAGASLDA